MKWGECIFENLEPPTGLPPALETDIDSLRHIFLVGSRANWDVIVSSKTIDELSQTPNEALREDLLEYGNALVGYSASNRLADDDHRYARDLARRLVDSHFLEVLPQRSDRELISHAIALGCDSFCTRDIRSIYRKRDRLRSIPIRILTTAEWWQHTTLGSIVVVGGR